MTKRFYDLHMHAYNLSHPNLSAFADRFNLRKFTLPLFGRIAGIFASVTGKDKKILNLLSIMDNDLGDYFLYIDHYQNNAEEGLNFSEFSKDEYNKVVLCPLVVDFGFDKTDHKTKVEKGVFYKLPPQKPVVTQLHDLFWGIKFYYEHKIAIKETREEGKIIDYDISHKEIPLEEGKKSKLLEIYPFMGINTQHYSYEQIETMLDKYFSDFSKDQTPKERYDKLYEQLGKFDGNVYKYEKLNYIFVGVKVYPPLGFHPWPQDDNGKEQEKVELVYKTCVEKGIPIITHCSTGGFKTIDDNKKLTTPDNWEKVLDKFPNLKLNFAHFGYDSKEWWEKINSLLSKTNVYTDFSDLANSDRFYKKLKRELENGGKKKEKVLFGSDFMINLLSSDSYNEYLKRFFDTNHLSSDEKKLFAKVNPETFLFGGEV